MKIAIAAAISVDGKLTKHDEKNIYDWISAEDQVHFRALIAEHQAIVMGRGTYETVKDNLRLDQNRLRIVLTSRPDLFKEKELSGKLEFHNETVSQLVNKLQKRGLDKILVVGGQQMITDSLKAKLVDKIYITIEPHLFGKGNPLLNSVPVDIRLKLLSSNLLNAQGTILLTYKVEK